MQRRVAAVDAPARVAVVGSDFQPSSSHSSFSCRCSSRHSRMRRKPRKCFSHQSRSFDCVSSSCAASVRLPQLEDADEFRLRIGELRMRVVGGRRAGRPAARAGPGCRGTRRSRASRAGSRARCAATSMRASFTSTGRRAICLPIGGQLAASSLPSTAPSSCSCCQPSAIARGSGGSRNGKSSMRPRPSDSMRRITPASAARRISGSV